MNKVAQVWRFKQMASTILKSDDVDEQIEMIEVMYEDAKRPMIGQPLQELLDKDLG